MAMAAVRAEGIILLCQIHAYTDRDRFLANVKMHKASDILIQIFLYQALLNESYPEHLHIGLCQ